MKKLKTIFSPAKLVLWLAIILLVFTAPQVNGEAMSKSEIIVTMLFVDKTENEYDIAISMLSPGKEKDKNQQVYVGKGKTLSAAVDSISLAVGREMGFAQCEIMGLGNGICEEGVMQALDYMTRTKKVGRNAVLINFEGDTIDFAKAVADINTNKALSLSEIINYDKRYLLSQDSNIESFYIGYFSQLALGIMPKISLITEPKDNAIEVNGGSAGSSGSSTSSSSGSVSGGGGSQPQYLLNNGTTVVFKEGKKEIELTPDIMEKVNIFVNNDQRNSIVLTNVNDHVFKDATVVVDVVKKDISSSATFKDGVPIYKNDVTLTVSVEEVAEEKLTKSTLRRNQELLTDTLVEKIKEKTTNDMLELVDYCKTNKIDLIGIYKRYYRFKYKQWNNYLQEVGMENYLNNVQHEIKIKVISEF